MSYQNELYHHGIRGQRWGVRRFQNEDGTLTSAGRNRYGHMNEYDDGDGKVRNKVFRNIVGGDAGMRKFAEWREQRHRENLEKAKASGNERDIQKYQSKLDAQSAANDNMRAYREHSSSAKLAAQNLLPTAISLAVASRAGVGKERVKNMAKNPLTTALSIGLDAVMASRYRHARARGAGRIRSLLEMDMTVGQLLRMAGDKKAYGKYIVFAEPAENEYYGTSK